MADTHTDKATRRAQRLAQARQLAAQAKQNHTTALYIPFTITSIGAGASFDAFGRGIGFLYALALALTFAVLAWGTVRLVPSVVAAANIERKSGPRKLLAILTIPVTTHGFLVVAAAVPAAVALVKTVGFYALGGALIVLIVTGAALLAAWVLDKR